MNKVQKWASHIKRQKWVWDDVYSVGGINHLTNLFHDIIPLQKPLPSLYGYNFIFNNQTNSLLGSDGYDNYQAPMDDENHQLFRRRMWVGGSLDYLGPLPTTNDLVRCEERIRNVRTVGSSVFVTIMRSFTCKDSPVMTEQRTIMYTNEAFQPTLKQEVHLNPNVSDGVQDSTSCTFRLLDVMRFSALSYNLHKIHYDRLYCASENLRDVVVSGPLLVLVMLHYAATKLPDLRIQRFSYRNSLPCYIDEEVQLVLNKHDDNAYEIAVMKKGLLLSGGIITPQGSGYA